MTRVADIPCTLGIHGSCETSENEHRLGASRATALNANQSGGSAGMRPTRLLEPLTRSDSDSGRIAVQGLRRVHDAVTDNDAPVPCTTAEIKFSSKV